ncbi:HEPN domain-containing protein [Amycolatopsis sp. NPDC051758]|uniref:ApeA N-terminal domain 1-containing protein n=1 Tax=Amycolatopsis sp. NPDC051758 TaxID=3363935 RepID=UPI003794DD72
MADRDEKHLLGRFWLAGQPEVTLPGWLDLSGPNPKITLAGQLTAPVEWRATADGGVQGLPASEFPDTRFTVHGRLSTGTRPNVTLLDADTYPQNFQVFGDLGAGSENGTQVFEGYWLVRGAHLNPGESILKAVVRFTYIDEWAAHTGLTKYQDAKFEDGSPVELSYREPEPKEASIPGRPGSIRLTHKREITSPTVTGMEIQHKAWLWIDAQASTLDALYNDFVAPVLNLASVMMDRSCKVTSLQVLVSGSEYYNRVHHPIVRDDHPVKPIKPGYSYLRLPDISLDNVANAIASFSNIDPVPTILASSLGLDSGRFLETDLMELAACAEGIDRRMHKDDETIFNQDTISEIQRIAANAVRCEIPGPLGDHAADQLVDKLRYFEPTYKERLLRLVEYIHESAPAAAGVATEWAKSLVDARNNSAHLLPTSGTTWETKIALRDSLKWILGVAILRYAGIDAGLIKRGLERHQGYAFFIRKARHHASNIYRNG